jgi:GH24 family phage-related lysozyme (muramidase)
MDVSSRGRAFLRAHEGEVLTGYLDPVGVPTIGTGATNRSKVATAYLKGLGVSKGRIVPGKTKLTKAQADQMFAAMLDQEYEPMVLAKMPKGVVAAAPVRCRKLRRLQSRRRRHELALGRSLAGGQCRRGRANPRQ